MKSNSTEKPGKSQLGDRMMKAVRPSLTFKDIGRIAQYVREGEESEKERMKGGGEGTTLTIPSSNFVISEIFVVDRVKIFLLFWNLPYP